jgi:hypothetical protein
MVDGLRLIFGLKMINSVEDQDDYDDYDDDDDDEMIFTLRE